MWTVGRIVLLVLALLALFRVRWAFVAYLGLALSWIPARAGFHLQPLRCEWAVTPAGMALSLTKWPHILLFAFFGAMCAAQLRRRDGRALAIVALAAALVGLVVELEETATRSGSCRMRDLFPDVAGAVVGAGAMLALRARFGAPDELRADTSGGASLR